LDTNDIDDDDEAFIKVKQMTDGTSFNQHSTNMSRLLMTCWQRGVVVSALKKVSKRATKMSKK